MDRAGTPSLPLALALAIAGCAVPFAVVPTQPPSSDVAAASSASASSLASASDSAPAPIANVMPEKPLDSDAELADDEAPSEGNDTSAPLPPASNPLLKLTDDELLKRYRADPSSVGSISVGPPSAGLLFNGVQLPPGDGWILQDPAHTWATQESVDALTMCIEEVRKQFPDSPAIPIGHFSAKNGGHLSPHRSHQSGRDVDVGYYHSGNPPKYFVTANESNLDLARTWLLVKTAIQKAPVDMIFIDVSIQRLLADFAIASGEDPSFVDDTFQSRNKNARAPVRHIHGHANHLHIRFHAPVAEQLGVRLAKWLPKPDVSASKVAVGAASSGHPAGGSSSSSGSFAQIRARSGDTLVVWAKRYGTTIEEIQRANGLSSTALRIGVVYRIPQKAPAGAAASAGKPANKKRSGKGAT